MEPTFRNLINLLESKIVEYNDDLIPANQEQDDEEEPDTADLMQRRSNDSRVEREDDPFKVSGEEDIPYEINYDDEPDFLLDPEYERDHEQADDTDWEDRIIDKIDRERRGNTADPSKTWGPGNRTPQQIARDIRAAELAKTKPEQVTRQQLARQYDLDEAISRLRQLAFNTK